MPTSMEQEKIRFHAMRAVERYRDFKAGKRPPADHPEKNTLNGIFDHLEELSRLLP